MQKRLTYSDLTPQQIETILIIRAIINDLLFFGERPNWTGRDLKRLFIPTVFWGILSYIGLVLLIGSVPLYR